MQRRRSTWFLAFAFIASWACLGVVPVAAIAAPAKAIAIQDVRVWAGPDGTRVVLDLSAPVRHTIATLRNPDRKSVV